MRRLSLSEVLRIHRDVLATSGGSSGTRDLGRLQSALAQPWATFDGAELYPDLIEKAAVVGFSIVAGHPFVDGNKRVGHAAMEIFLILNGWVLEANVDEQEAIVLGVASGKVERSEFTAWLRTRVRPLLRESR